MDRGGDTFWVPLSMTPANVLDARPVQLCALSRAVFEQSERCLQAQSMSLLAYCPSTEPSRRSRRVNGLDHQFSLEAHSTGRPERDASYRAGSAYGSEQWDPQAAQAGAVW